MGFFLAIVAKYFPNARLSLQIISGKVVIRKSIIFSGNSILFLDFSSLLSIFFLLDDAFASPAPIFFLPTVLQKQQFRLLRCLSVKFAVNRNRFTVNWLLKKKAIKFKCFGGPSHQENPLTS